MANFETVVVETDLLIVGGGMSPAVQSSRLPTGRRRRA